MLQRAKSAPLSPRERDRVRGKESSNPPHRQADASALALEVVYASVPISVRFPLTPALSLGEREKRLGRRVKPGTRESTPRGKSFPLSSEEGGTYSGNGSTIGEANMLRAGDGSRSTGNCAGSPYSS